MFCNRANVASAFSGCLRRYCWPATSITAQRASTTFTRSESMFIARPKNSPEPFSAEPKVFYRVVAGAGAVTGAVGRVVLALPVVAPVEMLEALPVSEPFFHGPHIKSARTMRTAATIAASVGPLMPLRRSSSGRRYEGCSAC